MTPIRSTIFSAVQGNCDSIRSWTVSTPPHQKLTSDVAVYWQFSSWSCVANVCSNSISFIRMEFHSNKWDWIATHVCSRESLVASVILGVDILHKNGLVLDFTQTPVKICQVTVRSCSVTPVLETPVDAVDDCAVPDFRKNFQCGTARRCGIRILSHSGTISGPVTNKRCNRGHLSLYS